MFSNAAASSSEQLAQAANLFRSDRVAFVRIAEEPFCPLKTLFNFTDFCALKMPNFKRDLLHRRRRDRQRRQKLGVSVALNDLSRDGRCSGRAFRRRALRLRVQMRERADGA